MRLLYVILGTTSLGLGILGIILPVLPTTPFLLLTAYLYSKGSTRFHSWFIQTWIYKKYLESYVENRSMTRKQKWTLLIVVDLMLLSSFILVESLAVKILIVILVIIKHIYFHTQVKIVKKQIPIR